MRSISGWIRRHVVHLWLLVCIGLGLSMATWEHWRLSTESRERDRSIQGIEAQLNEMGSLVDDVADFKRARRLLVRQSRDRRDVSGLPAALILQAVERAWIEGLALNGLEIDAAEMGVWVEIRGSATEPSRPQAFLDTLWTELGGCVDPRPAELLEGEFEVGFLLSGRAERCLERHSGGLEP